jgi:hypothetical protein
MIGWVIRRYEGIKDKDKSERLLLVDWVPWSPANYEEYNFDQSATQSPKDQEVNGGREKGQLALLPKRGLWLSVSRTQSAILTGWSCSVQGHATTCCKFSWVVK